MSGEGGRWEAWGGPLEKSLQRIVDVYVVHYDDRPVWVFSTWLKLTDKGEQVARALEEGAKG
jgi:hypothetical protein